MMAEKIIKKKIKENLGKDKELEVHNINECVCQYCGFRYPTNSDIDCKNLLCPQCGRPMSNND